MNHIVHFSGGVGSWAAAKRVAKRHGTERLFLLFADTLMEDEDLYRFIHEAANNIGGELVRISDGRTPWEVFRDVRFLGNSLVDPCSRILKRELLDRYVVEHFDPATTVNYVGIDWTEKHRFEGTKTKPGLKQRMAKKGWTFEAPLCEPPLISKSRMLADLECEGIRPPRLYEMGFPHNNCGGFCIKAGHAQFAHLLQVLPDRYLYHEQKEVECQSVVGSQHTILTDRSGDGSKKPLSLREFRRRLESGEYRPRDLEGFEWGGCGCAIDDSEGQTPVDTASPSS